MWDSNKSQRLPSFVCNAVVQDHLEDLVYLGPSTPRTHHRAAVLTIPNQSNVVSRAGTPHWGKELTHPHPPSSRRRARACEARRDGDDTTALPHYYSSARVRGGGSGYVPYAVVVRRWEPGKRNKAVQNPAGACCNPLSPPLPSPPTHRH
uniref:MT2177f n=1 Tax=Volvox carteri f. nagariensis TaxID=3068 RepID=D9CJ28_VOLCA|nr:MT2177f [Volvox carteri f. nagariensis]ADI46959.1 MT2177m [Volvox carteri f. nagariensis]